MQPRRINIRSDRIRRHGAYSWERRSDGELVIAPASSIPSDVQYPAFVPETDYEAVESWTSEDGETWSPGPLAVRSVNPSELTEWQVVGGGTGLIAAVALPELASSVGLPAAVFISVYLDNTELDVIDQNAEWALNIDVAQLLENAAISPIRSYIGRRGVAFVAYITGVMKDLGVQLPVLRLSMNCFWNKASTVSGALVSNVSASAPTVKELTDSVVASEEICPHCLRSDNDGGWTIVGRPDKIHL